MVKLVIFDMDGLMFDTERVTYRAFTERVKAWGYEPKEEEYLQLLGLNENAILKKYQEFFGKDIEAKKLYHEIMERKLEILQVEGTPVKKGLLELLDALDEKGIKKAVASGSSMAMVEENTESAGVKDRYDLLMSTEMVKRGKPFPDIFLKICEKFQTDPAEAIVLEDGANGVQAAIAGNIRVINIPDMMTLPEELAKQCVAVKESLRDVIPLLSSL